MAIGGSKVNYRNAYRDTNVSGEAISFEAVDALRHRERGELRKRVVMLAILLLVTCYLSLNVTGAKYDYLYFTPLEVFDAFAAYLHDFWASITHMTAVYAPNYIAENLPAYYVIPDRLSVIGLTLLCGILLSVSGMLYQNVFKNPIATPSMLGVGSGVSIGVLILVLVGGISNIGNVSLRYGLCYGCGAAVLVLVLAFGKLISGKGRPMGLVNMLLIGAIISQLLGVFLSYVTMFVMDPDVWLIYYEVSQMLNMDASPLSWILLGGISLVTLTPVYLLRFRLNALAFPPEEVRLLGVNFNTLRAVALLAGSLMILAAQVQIGLVAMVSLVVPFVSRAVFGCEFRRQLAGNVMLGMLVLLVCRTITDAIPFVGDGLAIGSIVSVVSLPLFIWIIANYRSGWE